MLKSTHVGLSPWPMPGRHAQAARPSRDKHGAGRAIALHYSPGNLISAVHGWTLAAAATCSRSIQRPGPGVGCRCRTGKPRRCTSFVSRLTRVASPTPRNQRPEGASVASSAKGLGVAKGWPAFYPGKAGSIERGLMRNRLIRS